MDSKEQKLLTQRADELPMEGLDVSIVQSPGTHQITSPYLDEDDFPQQVLWQAEVPFSQPTPKTAANREMESKDGPLAREEARWRKQMEELTRIKLLEYHESILWQNDSAASQIPAENEELTAAGQKEPITVQPAESGQPNLSGPSHPFNAFDSADLSALNNTDHADDLSCPAKEIHEDKDREEKGQKEKGRELEAEAESKESEETEIEETEIEEKEEDEREKSEELQAFDPASSPLSLAALVEGVLFAAGQEGLSLIQIQSVFPTQSRQQLMEVLEELTADYDLPASGIHLVCWAGRYKLVTKEEVFPYAGKLFEDTLAPALSSAALETLALIAYRQPITRAQIEEIRGVGCEVMLKKLQARSLIETCGRLDAAGKPLLYQVTSDFLDAFGLESLEDLPEVSAGKLPESLFEREEA